MSDRTSGALIAALEATLAELAGLKAARVSAGPFDAAHPDHRAEGARRVRVGIGGAEIDRVVWTLPAATAEGIAARMYFGMAVRDGALVDAAVSELFCRVSARALEAEGTLRIAAPPQIERGAPAESDDGALGVTVRFDCAAGPFTMSLFMPPA